MLIAGIPAQIPQSDVIASFMKHAAFLPFPDGLKFLSSTNMIYTLTACLTDWPLGSLYASNFKLFPHNVPKPVHSECWIFFIETLILCLCRLLPS